MSANFVMLAGKYDPSKAKFPYYASTKLDGVRAFVQGGKLWSRKKELIPNLHTQKLFGKPEYEGFDGELIVGEDDSPTAFNDTQSGVMRVAGEPDVAFFVFDSMENPTAGYESRVQDPKYMGKKTRIWYVTQWRVDNEKELLKYEEETIGRGFEGVMLRSPHSPYKFGRSTMNEGYLLKVKRFEDAEAKIISCHEENHNTNERVTNEHGVAKRSSAKAGKVGKGTLGKLIVQDCRTGVQFGVGSGFTAAQRASLWEHRTKLPDKLIKYRYQPAGVKEKPRFPTFIGMRDKRDL